MTITRKITFEIPDKTRIAEVQAAVTYALDEHSIVENVGGSGQVLTFRVRFANEAEVPSITHAARIEALHVTPCEMKVSR